MKEILMHFILLICDGRQYVERSITYTHYMLSTLYASLWKKRTETHFAFRMSSQKYSSRCCSEPFSYSILTMNQLTWENCEDMTGMFGSKYWWSRAHIN